MKSILDHAEPADFEFLVRVMKSPLHLSGTQDMCERLEQYRGDASTTNREALSTAIEREIRYAASADLAYATRLIWGREPGIATHEIINDVAKRLKVKVPPIGPVEAKLERLAEGVMARELFRLSPDDQRELIRSQGLGPKATNEAVVRIQKHGPVAIVPVLLAVLGRDAVEQLVVRLVTRAIGGLIGREAAAQLIANLALRFPWWTQWVGPVVWGATGIWAMVDIQGPAYRKTVPAVLYLSLIAMRNSKDKKGKAKRDNDAALDPARADHREPPDAVPYDEKSAPGDSEMPPTEGAESAPHEAGAGPAAQGSASRASTRGSKQQPEDEPEAPATDEDEQQGSKGSKKARSEPPE